MNWLKVWRKSLPSAQFISQLKSLNISHKSISDAAELQPVARKVPDKVAVPLAKAIDGVTRAFNQTSSAAKTRKTCDNDRLTLVR